VAGVDVPGVAAEVVNGAMPTLDELSVEVS
jgi:hypothetical protein